MAKHTEAAPQLPPASVDFNALHEACRAGDEPQKALKAAVIAETAPEPAPGSDEVPPADQGKDALDDMKKPELQQRARDLGIRFETDANVDRLKELLRAHPAGVPAAEPAPAA
jgi:hypothetical protein